MSATAMADVVPDVGPTTGGTTVTVSLPRITSARIGAGAFHTSVLAADGEVYSTGANWWGQLGAGLATSPHLVPQRVPRPFGVDRWMALSVGPWSSVAIGTDPSQVYAWGSNFDGELGLGPGGELVDYSLGPRAVDMSLAGGFVDVAAGSAMAAGIDLDGRIWVWGTNYDFGLGVDGPADTIHSPALLPLSAELPSGLRFVDVESSAFSGGTALGDDGRLYAWGSNYRGRIGDGTTDHVAEITEVLLPPSVRVESFDAGGFATYAIDLEGRLWAWGVGTDGELGDGATADSWLPVEVLPPDGSAPGFRWVEVVGGYLHALGRGSDGAWYAWGGNAWGQLGDGTTTSRSRPVPMTIAPDAITGAAAHLTGTIVASECGTYGIGENPWGELGNSTMVPTAAFTSFDAPLGDLEVQNVEFAGLPVSNPVRVDCDTWQVDTPAHPAESVDVSILYQSGPWELAVAVLIDGFSYGTAPSVTLDPADVDVFAGADVTLTASGTGEAPLSIRWEASSDGGSTWSDVPGATTEALTLTDVVPAASGHRYRARYSNAFGTAVSAAAIITVAGLPAVTGPGAGSPAAAPSTPQIPAPSERVVTTASEPAASVGGGGSRALVSMPGAARPSVATSVGLVEQRSVSILAIAAGVIAAVGGALLVVQFVRRAMGL